MSDAVQSLWLVSSPDGEIAYVDAGAGTVIVLIHGIGSAARSWAAQIAQLSQNWRVIAWNAPGYPPSAPLSAEWPSADDYAQRLAGLLVSLSVERCHIVGHSLGCLMAARFARLYPDRVVSLTLASCAIGHARLPDDERERLLASRIDDVMMLGSRGMAEKRGPRLLGPSATAQAVASVVEVMAEVDPHGYAQAARMLSRGDLIADIEAIPQSIPMQFIYGAADLITPPAVNLRAAAARPGAPVTVLDNAGHACYVERPDDFSAAIEGFARQHG
jgi:pimeloyl-ACP methyl ester carboxylesterase